MGSHAALVAKLESAKEGSRELSDEVLKVFDAYREYTSITSLPIYPENRPDPTRNLQDAVDLVPEGWGWQLGGSGTAYLYAPTPFHDADDIETTANTPALALVIAILKAVEAKDG